MKIQQRNAVSDFDVSKLLQDCGVMAVGVGFTASAVIAYVVSVRLGLLSREES